MTRPGSAIPSLLDQAMGCAASYAAAKDAKPAWPANPFPSGVQTGSATEKAIAALVAAYPRWLEAWELMAITGRSRGAIAWAMRYLGEKHLVRAVKSPRHPQYLRYQAIVKGEKQSAD